MLFWYAYKSRTDGRFHLACDVLCESIMDYPLFTSPEECVNYYKTNENVEVLK